MLNSQRENHEDRKKIISHIPLNMADIARLAPEATEEPGRQAQGLECSHCAKAQACGVSRYLNLPQVKQAKEYWLAKASQKVSSAGNQIKISRNASG